MNLQPKTYNLNTNRGFILLFSLLVSSVILAAGLSVTRIMIRQISLASIQKDSQMAFFAADAGVECGRYWKENIPGHPQPNISCNGELLKTVVPSGTVRENMSIAAISANNGTEYSFNAGGSTISDQNGTDVAVSENCVVVTICIDSSSAQAGSECADSTAPNGKIVAKGYNVECDPDTGKPMQGRVVERKLVYIYR